jgi:menaquinone-dependent protoporphyrinogen oxidase
MTVLVAAASKHGGTDKIAGRIGASLAGLGLDVEVRKLDEVADLSGYEAFVLGSGIYFGTWLKEARKFLDAHATQLGEKPTWLFASGSITGNPPVADDPKALRAGLAEALVETTHAREHKLFAGKCDKSALGVHERWAVRMSGAREGDYRDWEAIDAWGASIADELKRPTGTSRACKRVGGLETPGGVA